MAKQSRIAEAASSKMTKTERHFREKFGQEAWDRLVEGCHAGASLSELAKPLGLSRTSVNRIIQAAGIQRPHIGPSPEEVQDWRNKIRAFIQSSEPVPVSPDNRIRPRRILSYLGIPKYLHLSLMSEVPGSVLEWRLRRVAPDVHEYLWRLYHVDGLPVSELAREWDCSGNSLLIAMRRHGVPVKRGPRGPRTGQRRRASVPELPQLQTMPDTEPEAADDTKPELVETTA